MIKINRKGYDLCLSKDEKYLYLVAGSISKYDITFEKPVEILRLTDLEYPSRICLSSDEKLIACKNSMGYISINEIETGKQILFNKCFKKDGGLIHFSDNNKQILAANWGGNVFCLNIELNKITSLVSNPEYRTCVEVFHVNQVFYILSYLNHIGNAKPVNYAIEVRKIMNKNEGDIRLVDEVNLKSQIELCFLCNFVNGNKIYTGTCGAKEQRVMAYDVATKYMSTEYVISEEMINKYGYLSCICVTQNSKLLLVGLSHRLLIIDSNSKELLYSVAIDYLSSLLCMENDTKLIIGTWTKIRILTFEELFKLDRIV